jgi:hypothetical protein
VPFEVVTVTSVLPADPDGDVAVIEVAERTLTEVALAEPNLTAEAPRKPVPVMVTGVPPANGPTPGLTAVTVGAAPNVNLSA